MSQRHFLLLFAACCFAFIGIAIANCDALAQANPPPIVILRAPEPDCFSDDTEIDRPTPDYTYFPRLDSMGDPLPWGVLARVGHNRFRHLDRVWSMVASDDGSVVVSADSKNVYVWEAKSGRRLWCLPARELYVKGIASVAVAPDGKRLGIRTDDNAAYLIDLTRQQEPILIGHTPPPEDYGSPKGRFIAFSADGKRLILGAKRVVVAWDIERRVEVLRRAFVRVAGYCPATDQLAVFDDHINEVVILSLTGGNNKRVINLADSNGSRHIPIHAVFSAGGKYMALNCITDSLLIETASGRIVLNFTKPSGGSLSGHSYSAFSHDERLFADSGADGIRVWLLTDPSTPLRRWENWYGGPICFANDGKHLVYSHAGDSTCNLVDIDRDTFVIPPHVSVSSSTTDRLTHFRGTEYRFGSRIIDMNSGAAALQAPIPIASPAVPTNPSIAATILSSRGGNPTAVQWRRKGDGHLVREESLTDLCQLAPNEAGVDEHDRNPYSFASVSADGARIFVGFGSAVILLDAGTGKRLQVFNGGPGDVRQLVASPDGRTFATLVANKNASEGYSVVLWNADGASGTARHALLTTRSSNWIIMQYAPYGHFLLLGWNDTESYTRDLTSGRQLIQQWECDTGQLSMQFAYPTGYAGNLMMFPSGRFALTRSEQTRTPLSTERSDEVPYLIDLALGRTWTCRTLPNPIALFPDGRRVIVEDPLGFAPLIVRAPVLPQSKLDEANQFAQPAKAWAALVASPQEAMSAIATIADYDDKRLAKLGDYLATDRNDAKQLRDRIDALVATFASKDAKRSEEAYRDLLKIEVRSPQVARRAVDATSGAAATQFRRRLARDTSTPVIADVNETRRDRLVLALAWNSSKEANELLKTIATDSPNSVAGKHAAMALRDR